MGAASWEYYVPYQQDLNAALHRLREQVVATGEFHWYPEDPLRGPEEGQTPPRPTSMAEYEQILAKDWTLQETGSHSILDVDQVVGTEGIPNPGDVVPLPVADAIEVAGTDRLTRDHVEALMPDYADERWIGRYAILHNNKGEPTEIYFWGFSGD